MSESGSSRTPLILDTSVAAKWYLPEKLRDEALELSARMGAGEVELLAPSTIGPELFNAFYQQHRRGHLSLEEVRGFFSSFAEAPVLLFEIDPLTPRAVEVALAEDAGTVAVTADDRLLRALRDTSYAPLAHPLADIANLVSDTG